MFTTVEPPLRSPPTSNGKLKLTDGFIHKFPSTKRHLTELKTQ